MARVMVRTISFGGISTKSWKIKLKNYLGKNGKGGIQFAVVNIIACTSCQIIAALKSKAVQNGFVKQLMQKGYVKVW
jgi:TM2 domain-containing membrane protein YozV